MAVLMGVQLLSHVQKVFYDLISDLYYLFQFLICIHLDNILCLVNKLSNENKQSRKKRLL